MSGNGESVESVESVWERVEDWSPRHYETMTQYLPSLRQEISGAADELERAALERTYDEIVNRVTRYEDLHGSDPDPGD